MVGRFPWGPIGRFLCSSFGRFLFVVNFFFVFLRFVCRLSFWWSLFGRFVRGVFGRFIFSRFLCGVGSVSLSSLFLVVSLQ